MSKKVIEQLKLLKKTHEGINPNPEWALRSREQLMRQIQNSMGSHPEHASFASSFETFLKLFISQKAYYSLRTALVFVLAIGITVGGWIGGVSATHSCLPGNFCYNVKLAAEKTQVAVASITGSTDTKVALHLEFASRRLEEIRQVKNSHQVDAVNELKKSLNSVNDTLQKVKGQDAETATRVAKDISKKTSDIVQTLSDVTAADINVPIGTVKAIADATQVANDTGIQALEIALAGQPTGGTPSDDIKALVQQKIDTILDGSKESQETVHEVKNSVDASFASSTLSLSSSSAAVVLVPTTSSLDQIVSSSVEVATSTPDSLNQVVQKVDASVVQAQTVANEAKVLLDGNKVDEAFAKVKTLNTLVSENNNNVVQAQEAAGMQIVPPSVTTTTQDLTLSSTTTQ
ncbi:MAG: hypothetical protein A3B90_00410 [Candidatus Magasanikbacteria bacterium RIFCSPHIGHO2_02_FULL_41_13]|uniref:DUF5667 domain-containing protein n=1 Tax=Candidatus Magasanikbacteria bacterium RIFCSPHIGHO2_02_FULL_41_13 TaxID=1798676 RepID=A0A1F6M4F3_9BACT|nr:MAG: hypothetical protein A3B90_00410 [Candidatus Magasanikbacteria bacterium RIFCSPHIGHO2_02_FULL_41_13]